MSFQLPVCMDEGDSVTVKYLACMHNAVKQLMQRMRIAVELVYLHLI